MTSLAQSIFDRACNKLSSVEKKKEAVQRQIDVQMQAYALVPKSIDSNDTILYYRRERDRVSTKRDTEVSALDAKIKAVEAKKQAALEKIDTDIKALEAKKQRVEETFDIDIKALEAKKDTTNNNLLTEETRYVTEIQRFTDKLQNPEPHTPAFRKLKADLEQCVKEEQTAIEEYQDANRKYIEAVEKKTKEQIREQQAEYRKMLQAEAAKEAEERERIEKAAAVKMQKDMEVFKEAEERGKKLRKTSTEEVVNQDDFALKALENAYPRKVPRIEKKGKQLQWKDLNMNSAYCTSDLATLTVDADVQSGYEIDLYEKLWKDACIREKRDGWWSEDK
jgi:hypothetical protein